jgi:hypothetical protein
MCADASPRALFARWTRCASVVVPKACGNGASAWRPDGADGCAVHAHSTVRLPKFEFEFSLSSRQEGRLRHRPGKFRVSSEVARLCALCARKKGGRIGLRAVSGDMDLSSTEPVDGLVPSANGPCTRITIISTGGIAVAIVARQ